jgi:hypothetical protein
VLGRSNANDSFVFVTRTSVAPVWLGSSGLPGVGMVKTAFDWKVSFSRACAASTFRPRREPGTS